MSGLRPLEGDCELIRTVNPSYSACRPPAPRETHSLAPSPSLRSVNCAFHTVLSWMNLSPKYLVGSFLLTVILIITQAVLTTQSDHSDYSWAGAKHNHHFAEPVSSPQLNIHMRPSSFTPSLKVREGCNLRRALIATNEKLERTRGKPHYYLISKNQQYWV